MLHVWYIYLQNWVTIRANVGKYSIHGAYGNDDPFIDEVSIINHPFWGGWFIIVLPTLVTDTLMWFVDVCLCVIYTGRYNGMYKGLYWDFTKSLLV